MESLYILIPIAVIFVFIAVCIFIWAVKTDQFEDLERQGMNILLEENPNQLNSSSIKSPKDLKMKNQSVIKQDQHNI